MLSADWLQFSLVSDWLGSTPEVVLRVTDLYPIHDEALDCPDGLAATLVWLAAAYGHGELVNQRSSPVAPTRARLQAYGRTPFYVACAEGHIDIVKLLCVQKVDMCKADQDGTAPAHIAAACGHLEVIQYLHEQGVRVKHLGSIYDYDLPVGSQCLTKVTPLQIATHFKQCEIAQLSSRVCWGHTTHCRCSNKMRE